MRRKKKKIQFCTDNAIKVSIILKVDCSEIALSNLITLVIYDRFIYDAGWKQQQDAFGSRINLARIGIIVEKMIDPTCPAVQSWTLLLSNMDVMNW